MDQTQADALRVAINRLARRLRNEGSGANTLSATSLAVLGLLRHEGPQTIRALATAEHVKPPSMTRIVDALADAGYVTREAHPDDGRSVLVQLTDGGRQHIATTIDARSAWLHERLATLDEADRAALAAAIPALQRLGEAR